MIKNVSNSTKAPDLDEASFDLYTAKGLLEALRDQLDSIEELVCYYRKNHTQTEALRLAYEANRSFYTWMALLRPIQDYVDSSLATIDEVDK